MILTLIPQHPAHIVHSRQWRDNSTFLSITENGRPLSQTTNFTMTQEEFGLSAIL
jgi:hypothetical protein